MAMSPNDGYSVVPLAKGFLALRIIQIVLAVIVLALSAYGVSEIPYNAFCLAVFTALATMISIVYYIVATTAGKAAYNFWAIFSLEIFLLIFWLCTFATLAALTAAVLAAPSYDSSYFWWKRGLDVLEKRYYGSFPVAILYTDLAISVIMFLLFILSFVLFTVAMFKHRRTLKSDAPVTSTTTTSAAPAYAAAPAAEKGAHAHAAPVHQHTPPPQQQQMYAPPQQQHQQQPMYQQHPAQQQQPQQMYPQPSQSPVSYVQQPQQQQQHQQMYPQSTGSPSPMQQQAMGYQHSTPPPPGQGYAQPVPQGYAETGGASAPQVVHHQ